MLKNDNNEKDKEIGVRSNIKEQEEIKILSKKDERRSRLKN